MKIRAKIRSRSIQLFAVSLVAMLLTVASSLAAQETESIKIDGSSPVYPITQKIVEDYQANTEVGYIPLPEEAYQIDKVSFIKEK